MKGMRIAIGADHRGSDMLAHVVERLKAEGADVVVFACPAGQSCDYPDNAYQVGTVVASGQADRGVLVCGTGIGMSIAANKIKGVRAALVHDELTAEMSRSHNDANVLCLPADIVGVKVMDKIVDRWMKTPFEGGRHARRVRKITALENGQDPSSVKD